MICFYDTESGEIKAYMDSASAEINPIAGCSQLPCQSRFNPADYKVVDGDFVAIDKPSVDPLIFIRFKRDALLKDCDWTQMPDVALSPEKKAEWAAYRQILRDLPETCDPFNVIYPPQPD